MGRDDNKQETTGMEIFPEPLEKHIQSVLAQFPFAADQEAGRLGLKKRISGTDFLQKDPIVKAAAEGAISDALQREKLAADSFFAHLEAPVHVVDSLIHLRDDISRVGLTDFRVKNIDFPQPIGEFVRQRTASAHPEVTTQDIRAFDFDQLSEQAKTLGIHPDIVNKLHSAELNMFDTDVVALVPFERQLVGEGGKPWKTDQLIAIFGIHDPYKKGLEDPKGYMNLLDSTSIGQNKKLGDATLAGFMRVPQPVAKI